MKAFNVVTIIILLIFCGVIVFQRAELNDTKDQLMLTKLNLDITKSQLDTTETKLNNIKQQLISAELQLNNTQIQLVTAETELQTTAKQLSNAEYQLEETESQLVTTEYQLEIAEDEQKQMQNQYSNLREQINLRFGQGEDCQEFITPDNENISAKANEIAGNYSDDTNELWRDYEKLYRWVVNNIEYSNDSRFPFIPATLGSDPVWRQECWRMPDETLVDEVGDCEDMALLLASLMLSYNNQGYAVWAITISNEDGGHLAVAFPVAGDKLTILDPAGNYYTGYFSGRLRSDDINRAVNDWLSHWKKEMPNAEISSIFSNKLYREFSNTEEFINWVKER